MLATLGVKGVRLAAIAKGPDRNAGRETFFVEGREPFRLPPRDPALFFIQRLRDEAHRFAIGTHRARRKKEFVKSPLDEIPGIGPSRKRALLLAFGSAKAVARAGLADLEKTPGLNAATAKLVYDFFRDAPGAGEALAHVALTSTRGFLPCGGGWEGVAPCVSVEPQLLTSVELSHDPEVGATPTLPAPTGGGTLRAVDLDHLV